MRKKSYSSSGKNFDAGPANNFNMLGKSVNSVTPMTLPVFGSDDGTTGVDTTPMNTCQLLANTITDLQNQMAAGKYSGDGYDQIKSQLDIAWMKYNINKCNIKGVNPPDIVEISTVLPPSDAVDGNGNTGVVGPGTTDPPPSQNGDGLPFNTLSGNGAPSNGSGGGGGGSTGNLDASPLHKNILWIAIAASAVGGFFLFGGKNIAGGAI